MPAIIACPSCGGKLRVADELRGQRVRCPACQHIFDSAAEVGPTAGPPHASQDLPLDLTLDDPSSPPTSPLDDPGGLTGAIELKRSSDEPSPSPEPKPTTEPPPPRRPRTSLDQDTPDIRRMGPRRDAEPDRGTVVLTLGIISLALILVWCTAPIGAVLGLIAWIMGQIDLRKMKRGQMDSENRGMTQAGWICGILGTILNGLIMLSCGVLVGTVWYDSVSRLPNTTPIPATRPAAPPPPKKMPRPPKNRPGNQF